MNLKLHGKCRKQIMNYTMTMKSIYVTLDYSENHHDERMPVLDINVWMTIVTGSQKYHIFSF